MKLHSLSLLLALPQTLAIITSQYLGGTYPGWSSINTIFAFGDSYTDTDFSPSTPPTPSNPTGATYPHRNAFKSDKWITYLTTFYNNSEILTYNLARAGAVVNEEFIRDHDPSTRKQVYEQFLPLYGPKKGKGKIWDPKSTLFAFFIGINDCDKFASNATFHSNLDAVINNYEDQLATLIEVGAQHFLLLAVPTLYRGPDHPSRHLHSIVPEFNARVQALALKVVSAGGSAHFLDTEALFNDALDDVGRYPETIGIKVTEEWCEAYASGERVWGPKTKARGCSASYGRTFWRDGLHVGMKAQMLIAGAAARGLGWDDCEVGMGGLVKQQDVRRGRYARFKA